MKTEHIKSRCHQFGALCNTLLNSKVNLPIHEKFKAKGAKNPVLLVTVAPALTGTIVRTDVQNLPLVKSYPIWQMIESMEVFKKFPQNPNFEPLMRCNEVKREGAAIGHMMYFASLVEKISRLRENDPREDLESIMEGLAELEEMGFDVKVVRGRVSELLRIKVQLEKLICKLKGLESQIEECRDEKSRIAGTVADTERELKRLEEKRAKLMSEKMNNDSKELELISEADVIYKGISSSWEIFRSLVVAPW